MNLGVFDSGQGGKLIARKLEKALPKAKIFYRCDSKNFPYGNKTPDFIFNRLVSFTKVFQKLNCRIIIVACNSATTTVINRLRKQFPEITYVGIEPPVKPCAALTRTGKIAIIGTTATINSQRFQELACEFNRIKIFPVACPGLAEAIEQRKPTEKLITKYLIKPINAGVDVVGLACTHYPYLLHQLQRLFPRVTFYDPADAVVKRVMSIINS